RRCSSSISSRDSWPASYRKACSSTSATPTASYQHWHSPRDRFQTGRGRGEVKAEGRRQKAEGRKQKAESRNASLHRQCWAERSISAFCFLPSAFKERLCAGTSRRCSTSILPPRTRRSRLLRCSSSENCLAITSLRRRTRLRSIWPPRG